MKGGLAASIIAAEAFIEQHPDFSGGIESLGTADEESGAMVASPIWAEHGHFNPDRVQHVIIPRAVAKRRICRVTAAAGGPRSKPRAKSPRLDAVSKATAPAHMGGVAVRVRKQLFPAMAARHKISDTGGWPEGRRSSTIELINSIMAGKRKMMRKHFFLTGCIAHCVPDSCRHPIDRRFLLESHWIRCAAKCVRCSEGLTRNTGRTFDYELTEAELCPASMTNP